MLALCNVAFFALLFSLVDAATVDPRFAANLTIYHVNEVSYPSPPINMNTANLNGDMYFDLRTRGLPLECGIWRHESFWSSLDCTNPEVANVSKLAITKLVLEVDTRWGDYADCNVDPITGIYSCECEGVPDNCTALTPGGLHDGGKRCNNSNDCSWDSADKRCEAHGCANITDRLDCVQGYGHCMWDAAAALCRDPLGPKPVCNKSLVGFLNLSNVDWGQHPHHGYTPSTIDYWHGNVLSKTNGYWYSTWAEGECRPDDPTQKFCSWRLVGQGQKISKACSDAAINKVIVQGDRTEAWGAQCFDKCPAAEQKNATSQCWLECFYANVLGPRGSSQLLNHSSPNFGIPLHELQAAWDKPFLPIDQGGCPVLHSSAVNGLMV